jgi:hypothetical protein
MFVDGKGLTQTKIYWEWLVIATFTLTILIFLKNLVKNRNRILLMFLLGFIATIFSELAFMLYRNPFDVFNLTGHLLKLVAYLFFIFGVYYSIRKE